MKDHYASHQAGSITDHDHSDKCCPKLTPRSSPLSKKKKSRRDVAHVKTLTGSDVFP